MAPLDLYRAASLACVYLEQNVPAQVWVIRELRLALNQVDGGDRETDLRAMLVAVGAQDVDNLAAKIEGMVDASDSGRPPQSYGEATG
jgi:hypothetical protein